jgi:uncharacterized membrane protein YagU involved in acid resistance
MERFLHGMLAGLSATGPMTVVMLIWHRLLPRHEQYPIPPYVITTRAVEETSASNLVDQESERVGLTVASHFGFGAAAGALYGLLADALPLPGPGKGTIYGLLVWAAYYLGILPATGLYRPPQAEPLRRHGMMIMAHVVWGLALGSLFAQLRAMSRRRTVNTRGERYGF